MDHRTQALPVGNPLDLPVFEADPPHVKINPRASWSTVDLAAYAAEHRLPPHPLVAEGFASIGCAPCSTALRPGEDTRAGRWRGFDKTECGIHGSRPAGKQNGGDGAPPCDQ